MFESLSCLLKRVSRIWVDEADVGRGAGKEEGEGFGSHQEGTDLVGFDVNFGKIHEEGLRNEIIIIYFLYISQINFRKRLILLK